MMQLRRIFSQLCLAAFALAIFASSAAAAPRNVLLYVVDDQGTDDAGCYGNPVIKTPGLDELAKHGTRFTHAFCTTSSCSASRSVILTGLYNHANGQYGHQHSFHHFYTFDGVKSLPVLLAEAGYRTARAGKFHVAPERVYQFGETIRGAPSPAQMADNCRGLIAAESDKPFFLYFCTSEPHRPFRREGSDPVDPKDVIVPPYLPDTRACREELAKYYMSVERADAGLLRLIEILKETGRWDETLVIYISDNGIAFPGAKTTLYEPGMRLPCVVRNPYAKKNVAVTEAMVTFADITPTIYDFARGGPIPTTTTSARVVEPGEEHPKPVGEPQVAVPVKLPDFHGRSFLPVLEQENPEGWDEIYASHTFHEITMYYPMRVVRTKKYKLIWNIAHGLDYPFASDLHASATWQDILKSGATHYGKRTVKAYLHRPKFELYDLENDPHEVENLADDADHAKVLAELQGKLKAFQKRTGDPWIVKWEYE